MRVFLAVDPGERLREEVERHLAGVRHHAPHARWSRPEVLHVTLAFLGSIEESRLAAVIEAAGATAQAHAPFPLSLRGAGTFGARPRVLWMAVEAPALVPLQADLAERLRAQGFELEDRAFTPHLTLARAGDPRGDRGLLAAAGALAAAASAPTTIRQVEVMESRSSPQGSRYELRFAAPLAGP